MTFRLLLELFTATPHTRGSTVPRLQGLQPACGYPAYAGIDPIRKSVGIRERRLPRIRGDRPEADYQAHVSVLATPHTRGSTWYDDKMVYFYVGYPAYAGIDPFFASSISFFRGLPRIRGDRPYQTNERRAEKKATPHTRGST